MLKDARINGIKPFVQSGMSQLQGFAHSVEQLQRLHSIAKDVVNSKLNTHHTSSTGHVVTIFSVALLLGAVYVPLETRGYLPLFRSRTKITPP